DALGRGTQHDQDVVALERVVGNQGLSVMDLADGEGDDHQRDGAEEEDLDPDRQAHPPDGRARPLPALVAVAGVFLERRPTAVAVGLRHHLAQRRYRTFPSISSLLSRLLRCSPSRISSSTEAWASGRSGTPSRLVATC